jgi:arsenite methyltransferase
VVDTAEIKDLVRARYGSIAVGASESCCGPATACCGPGAADELSGFDARSSCMGYSAAELEAVPEGANLGLGCGNPQAIAALRPGEVVVDLGSGAGFDCLLAARQVGATGRVIGVDMTHEMLKKARGNAARVGAAGVEFRLGEIEHLPVADNTADVIISNCVINLVPDKAQVFREAFRVLKPGGRFAVSDVVTRGAVPEALRRDMLLWVGCIAGALDEKDYRMKLAAAGFEAIGVEPTRIYRVDDAREFLAGEGVDVDAIAPLVDGKFMSAFVRALKPAKAAPAACCGPTCCN